MRHQVNHYFGKFPGLDVGGLGFWHLIELGLFSAFKRHVEKIPGWGTLVLFKFQCPFYGLLHGQWCLLLQTPQRAKRHL